MFVKDPNAVLDYEVDWTSWLQAGETITTSTWTVPAGLTQDSATSTDTTATIWLSAGTLGTEYIVTNQVTTSQGRTDDRSIRVLLQNR